VDVVPDLWEGVLVALDLTKKYGPLPGYAWAGIGVLGIVGIVWWKKRQAANAASSTAQTASGSGSVGTGSTVSQASGDTSTGGGDQYGPPSNGGGIPPGVLSQILASQGTASTAAVTPTAANGNPTGPTPGYIDQNGNWVPLTTTGAETTNQAGNNWQSAYGSIVDSYSGTQYTPIASVAGVPQSAQYLQVAPGVFEPYTGSAPTGSQLYTTV
jgi:cytoskeletal protein RodZ